MKAVSVRPLEPRDEARWRDLWAGYCAFYQVAVSPAVTDFTWRRLSDPASDVVGWVAEADGAVIGIANCVVHENTWELRPVCYLEDLFVDPQARRLGAARALLARLREELQAGRWSRVYWMTRVTNHQARALYAQFTARDDFVRYVMAAR